MVKELNNNSSVFQSTLKSIVWCFLLLILYVAYESKEIVSVENPLGFLQLLSIFGMFYLPISIIGWLVIGLPWHWFLASFTNKSYFLYAFPALMFIVGSIVFKEYELGFVYGFFALIQALIFRYYVFKKI